MGNVKNQPVRCSKCGAELSRALGIDLEARGACPVCGSTARTAGVDITASMQASSHVSVLREHEGEATGFTESERQNRTSSGSLQSDGSVNISVIGSSPQGEEDTNSVCEVLRERLNGDGAHWGSIVLGREPADRILVDSNDPNVTLEVQVVRAIASQTLWRELNLSGSVQRLLSPTDAADEIRVAIESKARPEKIPEPTRPNLVLALDATRLASLAFDGIVREFRSANLKWTASHGFAAVWLVGPISRLVWRLDA